MREKRENDCVKINVGLLASVMMDDRCASGVRVFPFVKQLVKSGPVIILYYNIII